MVKRIAYLAPNQEKLNRIEEVLQEYKEEIIFEIGSLDAGVATAKKLIDQGVEIIIARGETAFTIRDTFSEIVSVDVPISGIDLALALEKSKQIGEKVAVVSFASMIKQIELLEAPLGVKIRKYELPPLPMKQEIHRKIEQAFTEGADVLLGGFSTGVVAREKKLPYVEIPTSDITYLETFFHARSLLKSIEQEKMRSEIIRAVLDHSHEGILSVDLENKINLINPVAKQILKYSHLHDGERKIEEICPQLDMSEILNQGIDILNQIYQIHSIQVLCNKVPIKNRGKVIGAVATFQDITKIQEMESQIRKELYAKGHVAKYQFDQILAYARSTQQTIELAKSISESDGNVIISGETGTGKEVFAQSIHQGSERKKGPFVAVNCASLSSQLLEIELFGYTEGAFAGAQAGGKKGFFEVAHGGTLFLDEIGEIDYVNQGRLLRVLQEQAITRLGSDQLTSINVRIIASTKNNLWEEVEKGTFRKELYYRLNVFELSLPPLRERKKDIPHYARFFLDQATKKNGKKSTLSLGAVKKLSKHQWPGNLRELQNMMERLASISPKEHISASYIEKMMGMSQSCQRKFTEKDQEKKELIHQALIESQGNLQKTAEILHLSRVTLWSHMKQLGINKDDW